LILHNEESVTTAENLKVKISTTDPRGYGIRIPT
jgi:hypothetical protein